MTMKQTQTKMFDFADVGLDFCSGSKNLFPDRFKKMLSQGYNEQTVASVSVTGNQVTLNYGVAHGYAADRVLKINSGPLAVSNSGEYWIDAVTTTSLTMTIDAAPVSIAGGFSTKIASLGYALEYENSNIQVYKFKSLDESDLFLRLCFQDQSGRRNCISPCVGKSFDIATGFITDVYAYAENIQIQSPNTGFKWEFGFWNNTTYNNYTYTQGFSQYGRACVVGSQYHLLFLFNALNEQPRINGLVPTYCHAYELLSYPVLIGETYGNITSIGSNYQGENARAYVGNIRVALSQDPGNAGNGLFRMPSASSSYLPTKIDSFSTTTCAPLHIYEYPTLQHLGVVIGGLYSAMYGTANTPSTSYGIQPSVTVDIDLNSLIILHYISAGTSTSSFAFLAAPVEEIKIA